MNVIIRAGSGNDWSAVLCLHTIRLAVRAVCIGLGVAATASIYSRLYRALGDPLPAAIITLLAVMAFLVVIAPRADQR
ncbi:DMT family transporter [Sphingomonas sp. Leaf62]|uniref:DMT family transporter n=1 Tax=Sphingomonas sp. Leaf62 TaxID=1736228 RepID=UPI0006F8E8DA|nr:DMT family transporter [Sphingomonas sp. Leaf62]KQN79974.1 hypothetical protein ASE91_12050 [Sphingomonas sp. Leaf62]